MKSKDKCPCGSCLKDGTDACFNCVNCHGTYTNYKMNPETFEWDASVDLKDGDFIRMGLDGIYTEKVKIASDGSTKHILKKVWEWDEFQIQRLWENTITTDVKYDYCYNGKDYQNEIFKCLTTRVAETSLIVGRTKSYLGRLATKYITNNNIPIQQYATTCGFTTDGWRLPGDHRFDINDPLQSEIHEGLGKMVSMEINLPQAITDMHALYHAAAMDHKDLVFAIGMILPFQYAMLSHTKLSPHYTFYSPSPETGKTEAARLITTRWWNVTDDVMDKEAVNSVSRFGSYGASSTFGLVIDDCGELDDKIKGTIKTYQTGKSKFTRKNKENGIQINTEYKAPWVLTLNDFNKMFDDDAYLTRNVVIPMETKLTPANNTTYSQAVKPNGYFGKAIYTALKDITLEELKALFDEQLSIGGIRENAIYGLVATGTVLFERVFGIPLNITALSSLIITTKEKTNDVLGDAFRILVKYGSHAKQDRPNWIVNSTLNHIYKDMEGILLTSANIRDLNKYLGTSLSIPSLHVKLTRLYGDQIAPVMDFKHNGKKVRAIWYDKTIDQTFDKYPDQDIIDDILGRD